MIIVLKSDAPQEKRDELVRELEDYGLDVRPLTAGGRSLLHVASGPTRRARRVLRARSVEALVPTSGPRLRREGHRIYPYHFIHWCAAGVVIFGAMVLFAGQLPPGTGAPIRLDGPPELLDWPWYLRAPRAVLVAFSPESRWMGWGLLLGLLLAVFLLPFFDRTRGQGLRHRWPFAAAGLALLAAAIFLSLGEVAS